MLHIVKKTLRSLYQHYEMITCIYMFEPWEKTLINGFICVIMSLLLFSSIMYLPSYIETFLQFISPLPIDANPKSPIAPMLQTDKLNHS